MIEACCRIRRENAVTGAEGSKDDRARYLVAKYLADGTRPCPVRQRRFTLGGYLANLEMVAWYTWNVLAMARQLSPAARRPDGQSALNLAAARLRHVAGTEWSTKRYLSMDFLKDHQLRSSTA